jgi:DeoR/GlpR family transcriptional regulator of sugar metabolism
VTPSLICPIEDVDVLVTDAGTSDDAAAEFTKSVVKVIRA